MSDHRRNVSNATIVNEIGIRTENNGCHSLDLKRKKRNYFKNEQRNRKYSVRTKLGFKTGIIYTAENYSLLMQQWKFGLLLKSRQTLT